MLSTGADKLDMRTSLRLDVAPLDAERPLDFAPLHRLATMEPLALLDCNIKEGLTPVSGLR
jgi:hypothetical protein